MLQTVTIGLLETLKTLVFIVHNLLTHKLTFFTKANGLEAPHTFGHLMKEVVMAKIVDKVVQLHKLTVQRG